MTIEIEHRTMTLVWTCLVCRTCYAPQMVQMVWSPGLERWVGKACLHHSIEEISAAAGEGRQRGSVMANTVQETNNLLEEAYHDAVRAQTKLDWILGGSPTTPHYEIARTAARAAHPALGTAIDVLRAARTDLRLGGGGQ